MTENNYSTKKAKNIHNRFQLFMLTVMCMLISVVSFIAFFRIENNLHALMILLLGMAMSVLIFVTGKSQTYR